MISIIIPIYNTSEDMLLFNFKELMKIKRKDIEFILIDDGSEEYIGKICNQYTNLDKRFVYYKIKNSGVSNARNVGIGKSNGDFLIFLDSDDFLKCDIIDELNNDINCDLIMFDYNLIYDSGRIELFHTNINYGSYDKSNIKDFMSKAVGSFSFNPVHSKIYKKKIILDNNIYFPKDIKIGEDLIFNLSYLACCKKITYKQIVLTNYRVYENSSVRKFPLDRFNDFIMECDCRLNFIENKNLVSAENKVYDCCQKLLFSNVLNSINCGNEVNEVYERLNNKIIQKIILYKKSKLINKLKMKILFHKKLLLKACKLKKMKKKI